MEGLDEIHGPADRTLRLMTAIASAGTSTPLEEHARTLGIPVSTAYRIVALLMRHGLVAPGKRGSFGPGLKLASLATTTTPAKILTEAARTPIRRLARTMCATAHLGVLDNDMVTYLVKERGGGAPLFTREDGQLEAYCSAIGKVLLASINPDSLDAYLNAGPFVALTARTKIEVDLIRAEIETVTRAGFATDDEEVSDGLQCVAVPVRDAEGRVVAAVSLSRSTAERPELEPAAELVDCAHRIERRLGYTEEIPRTAGSLAVVDRA